MSAHKVLTLQPTAEHTHTIIFLHGRGATAAEFLEEFFESQASDNRFLPEIFPQVRWVFPTSGILPSRAFGEISQWYDMLSTDTPAVGESEHQTEIDAAVSRIVEIIRSESTALGGSYQVILAGISQGCTIGIQALLRQDSQLGGFIGLSSWLPASLASMQATHDAKLTPIFLSHSVDDDTIAFGNGEDLHNDLESKGFNVEWHRYENGGHWVNEPQGVGKWRTPAISHYEPQECESNELHRRHGRIHQSYHG